MSKTKKSRGKGPKTMTIVNMGNEKRELHSPKRIDFLPGIPVEVPYEVGEGLLKGRGFRKQGPTKKGGSSIETEEVE